jgi:flavin reductase (DIM6/NTAB) family NADH-FMN oxidoreductase RutF
VGAVGAPPAFGDVDAFRDGPGTDRCVRLYRKLAAGVSVVGTAGADGPVGATVSAVTSVSLRPPMLLVSLSLGSRTLAAVERRRAFSVALLRADQQALAEGFARPGGPRFAGVAYRELLGVPVLSDSLAWSVCLVADVRTYGDHSLVIGEVVAAHAGTGRPLVWHDQKFAELGE